MYLKPTRVSYVATVWSSLYSMILLVILAWREFIPDEYQ